MSVRDQLRLAIEIQNGIVDRFVEARMAHMDVARLFGLTEESRLLAWLYFGEPQEPTPRAVVDRAFTEGYLTNDQYISLTGVEPTVTVDWYGFVPTLTVADADS